MDIVVSGGTDPDRPLPAPKDRPSLLLPLIAVGVFLAAAGTAYTGWTVHETQQDNRLVNCFFVGLSEAGAPEYDELTDSQKEMVDRLGCDVKGR
jgi:hypothetical protein